MFRFSPGQWVIELRRFLQVQAAIFDLLVYAWIVKLHRPRGLRKRSMSQRVFGTIVRRFMGYDRPEVSVSVKLRETLEYLGPTYVKLGQIMSLREDMLPERITRELRKLQTQVPPFPFAQVKRVVETELNRPLSMIYERFEEEPIASASLAQAHVAYLHGGQKVAVKVQRPGIVRLIINDLNILRRVGAFMEKIPYLRDYRPRRMIREFAEYTMRELDFVQEGRNADIFRENFRDEPRLIVPEVYWEHTSRRVLTLEFIHGIEPNDRDRVLAAGIDGKSLAVLGAKFSIQMLYVDGFFHGDPHPGNLLIVDKDKIALLDMGMIGSFSENTMKNLFLYYYFLVLGEYDEATKYLLKLCSLGPGADEKGFRREIAEFGRQWVGADFMNYSLGKLILKSMTMGAKYKLFFDSDIMLGVKSVVTIEAVGYIMYPEMSIADISRPMMNAIFAKKFAPTELIKPVVNSLPDYMEALVNMPNGLLRTAKMISDGKFQIEVKNPPEEEESALEVWAPRLSVACLVGGTLLSVYESTPGPVIESFLGLTGMPILAMAAFAASGLLFLKAVMPPRWK